MLAEVSPASCQGPLKLPPIGGKSRKEAKVTGEVTSVRSPLSREDV